MEQYLPRYIEFEREMLEAQLSGWQQDAAHELAQREQEMRRTTGRAGTVEGMAEKEIDYMSAFFQRVILECLEDELKKDQEVTMDKRPIILLRQSDVRNTAEMKIQNSERRRVLRDVHKLLCDAIFYHFISNFLEDENAEKKVPDHVQRISTKEVLEHVIAQRMTQVKADWATRAND